MSERDALRDAATALADVLQMIVYKGTSDRFPSAQSKAIRALRDLAEKLVEGDR
jgi:hypothetical protein